MLGTGQ